MSPRSLASWYSQLASLTRAGVTLPGAVMQASGPKFVEREKLAARLESGDDPREVWPEAGAWLPQADALVLAAGQLSGRFPDVCTDLAERHATRARLRAKLFLGALYPVFLLHASAVVMPFIHDVDFSGRSGPTSIAEVLTSGVLGAVRNLVLLWGVAGALWLVFTKRPDWRAAVLRRLPVWSGVSRHAALATFAGTLASLLRAGVGIAQAWEFAGKVSGDPKLVIASARIARDVETTNEPPGKLMRDMTVFPEDFRGLYLAGERSGKLEEHLDRLRERHEADATTRATFATVAYPTALTVLAMLLIATRIVSFAQSYFGGIEKMAQ